jgi:type II secretory pathway pseudopilin PulG
MSVTTLLSFSSTLRAQPSHRSGEAGYTLVALLAVMTLMALFAMAAAPSILQQAQREREKEAIFRGEEVAEAIRLYYNSQVRNGRPGADTALPTSIDNLLEGVTIAGRTKKLQVLRVSAARDPLSSTGEWRLVRPRSPQIVDFLKDLMSYAGNIRPATRDQVLQRAEMQLAPPVVAISGLTGVGQTTADDLPDSSTGPFIGVSSRSNRNSIITYYGIDRHDHWVFTPLFR